MKANAHGIITEQPEGELRHYNRSGGATYAPIYFIAEQQDGISAEDCLLVRQRQLRYAAGTCQGQRLHH